MGERVVINNHSAIVLGLLAREIINPLRKNTVSFELLTSRLNGVIINYGCLKANYFTSAHL